MSDSSDDSVTFSVKAKIAAAQQEMKAMEIGAFLVPSGDCFLSEYPPESAKRLEWLTGFTGSAGTALILADPVDGKPAVLFTDGRYTLQAAQQLDSALFHIVDMTKTSPVNWLKTKQPDTVLGFDPWLHAHGQIRQWKGVEIKPVHSNPVDAIWSNQPGAPREPMVHHTLDYAGESSATKREKLLVTMREQSIDAIFLALPDGINWLLNIRGSDIPFNPLVLCYALLEQSGQIKLFIQEREVHLNDLHNVEIFNLQDFWQSPASFMKSYKTLQIDPSGTVAAIMQAATEVGCEILETSDPTLHAKAVKNPIEMDGMRAAHRRDGKALSQFLEWFETQDGITEMDCVDRLESFRREVGGDLYRGPSFDTISGSGPNGAVIHYRVTEETNRTIQDGELYLVDSGGQYLDGTTDVTRTVIKGMPTDEMIDRFTRVLKGHIAIATAIFPKGTTGSQLDVLARQALWDAGLDYAHGTGHGVGSFLCVHEGPQRISKRGGDVALQPGMILSNEPGYYKEGEYGIRIENLVLVTESDHPGYLAFETLTLAPMDERLIDASMLNEKEKGWLRCYHERVKNNA